MNVNWKVRLKNKVWLTSFFAAILTFVYTVLGLCDVFPNVTRNEAGEIINSALMMLSLFGVIIDPTTAGVNDSARALMYEEPYKDKDPAPKTEENKDAKPEEEKSEEILDSDESDNPSGESEID